MTPSPPIASAVCEVGDGTLQLNRLPLSTRPTTRNRTEANRIGYEAMRSTVREEGAMGMQADRSERRERNS
jgi:hypothetical protein